MTLNLYLAVRPTEDPETVVWAVLGPDGQPGVMGTFPRLAGPPAVTVQAICDMLADLIGCRVATPPEQVQAGAFAGRGNPNLN